MSNYPRINIHQIDLEALEVHLASDKKFVFNGEKSYNAPDTDKVAGVNSGNIAKAVNKYEINVDDELEKVENQGDKKVFFWNEKVNDNTKRILSDRNTVRNSARLGGLPASEYMTLSSGNSIGTIQNKMIDAYGEEIKDLRDELYQLRHELERNHIVNNYGFYNGFSDNFSIKGYRNIQDAIGQINVTEFNGEKELTIENNDVYDAFGIGDYICFVTQNNYYCITQIKNKDNHKFYFENGLSFAHVGDANKKDGSSVVGGTLLVYKSKGVVHNGMYKFTTEPTQQPGEAFYSGLGDDKKTTVYVLDTPESGLAYSFRIIGEGSNDGNSDSFISQQGYLESFKILVKPEGEPGRLNCYVIDMKDLDKWKNPSQFEDLYNTEGSDIRFFAKTFAQYSGYNNKQYVTFNFEQDGVYPLMSQDIDYENEKVQYVVIITADGVNKATGTKRANRYNIICLQKDVKEDADLEPNYRLFDYVKQDNNSIVEAITETDNTKDLYFQIVTRAVVKDEPYPLSKGLYTFHYGNQNMKSGLNGQTARLMLRIKREGKFATNVSNISQAIFDTNTTINVKADKETSSVDIDDIHFDSKDFYVDLQERNFESAEATSYPKAVIGNNITTITTCNPKDIQKNITVKTPVLINNKDKVVRVGYNVAIKARELKHGNQFIANEPYDRYVMHLSDVCKDFDPTSNDFSDRLIFEADLKKEIEVDGKIVCKKYNDFEVTVYWEHEKIERALSNSGNNTLEKRRSLTGALKDVVLSIDKNF